MIEVNYLATERLILKPTSEDDASFIFELLNTPKWIKYIGNRNVHSIAEAKLYIQNRMRTQFERLGYSNYTIIRKSDFQKIGTCGLYDRAGINGIDIGFALLPEFEKLGYAYEATTKLKDTAFNLFGINVLYAITTNDNYSSQQLLEKLGLTLIGTTFLPNDDTELLLYKIERTESYSTQV